MKYSGVYLSTIDGDRFGICIARCTSAALDQIPAIIEFCHANNVELLVARVSSSDIRTVHAMEQAGFLLMDTLVYYTRDVIETPIPEKEATVIVRPVQAGEASKVQAVAAEAFRGYCGHYHADKRLDRSKCDEAYADWALRSCSKREVADEVIVAEWAGKIVGFLSLRHNNGEEGEGLLFGVEPTASGLGVGRSLMIIGMEWCREQKMRRMLISTQLVNLPSQRVWSRLGFELKHSLYTFHCWFNTTTNLSGSRDSE